MSVVSREAYAREIRREARDVLTLVAAADPHRAPKQQHLSVIAQAAFRAADRAWRNGAGAALLVAELPATKALALLISRSDDYASVDWRAFVEAAVAARDELDASIDCLAKTEGATRG